MSAGLPDAIALVIIPSDDTGNKKSYVVSGFGIITLIPSTVRTKSFAGLAPPKSVPAIVIVLSNV